MKGKIFSIAFALVLVLSLSLIPAVPAAADTAAREAAVIAAADRLVTLQNADGGFPWKVTDPASASATNCLGVTAMGILKAYGINDKVAYRTALGNAYKFCVDNPPAYTWDGSKYTESTKGVDSFPDATFLVALADTAGSDANLMAAIKAQVPGTTASTIADLAKSRWDNRVLYLGSTQQDPPNGTATGMAHYIRDARHSQDYDALILWDLEAGVKAALALDGAFPGEGYDEQAEDITDVIYASIDDGTYFSSTDTTQEEYIAGLTGAIEAAAETGLYTAKASSLLTLLLDEQQAGGYWDYYGATPATMSVQSTAYAVMALLAEGSEASITAVNKAADWLVSSQKADGGWYSEDGEGDEYAEIDSEAAWALALSLGGGAVNLTANVPDIVAISVNPTSIDFGTLLPGQTSDEHNIVVTNIGTRTCVVDVDVSGSSEDLFYDHLQMRHSSGSPGWTNTNPWDDIITGLTMYDSQTVQTRLPVPSGYTPGGEETATLTFTATASS